MSNPIELGTWESRGCIKTSANERYADDMQQPLEIRWKYETRVKGEKTKFAVLLRREGAAIDQSGYTSERFYVRQNG